jgi:hypothetical protein
MTASTDPISDPITVAIPEAMRLTGMSRSGIYEAIGSGNLDGVKDGSRTLITMASIRRRQAALPPAKIKPAARRQGAAE